MPLGAIRAQSLESFQKAHPFLQDYVAHDGFEATRIFFLGSFVS
jgi:hypothetical protein